MKNELAFSAEVNGLIYMNQEGERGFIGWNEIESIDLSTLDAFTTEVDYISIAHTGGTLIEVNDLDSGFDVVADALSTRFRIQPAIKHRFPLKEGGGERVFTKNGNQKG